MTGELLDEMAFVLAHGVRREISLDRIQVTDRQSIGPFGEKVIERVAVLGKHFGVAFNDQPFRQTLEPNIRCDIAVEIDTLR